MDIPTITIFLFGVLLLFAIICSVMIDLGCIISYTWSSGKKGKICILCLPILVGVIILLLGSYSIPYLILFYSVAIIEYLHLYVTKELVSSPPDLYPAFRYLDSNAAYLINELYSDIGSSISDYDDRHDFQKNFLIKNQDYIAELSAIIAKYAFLRDEYKLKDHHYGSDSSVGSYNFLIVCVCLISLAEVHKAYAQNLSKIYIAFISIAVTLCLIFILYIFYYFHKVYDTTEFIYKTDYIRRFDEYKFDEPTTTKYDYIVKVTEFYTVYLERINSSHYYKNVLYFVAVVVFVVFVSCL